VIAKSDSKLGKVATIVMTAVFMATLIWTPVALAENQPKAPQAHLAAVGTVRGVVFQDWNQNGVRDAGEPGLPEAVVALINAQSSEVARIVTGLDGNFGFEGVAQGKYTVIETDPLGYSSLQGNAVAVTVRANSTIEVNFGDVLLLVGPAPMPTPAPAQFGEFVTTQPIVLHLGN
jgi:hypothetical protein